MNRLIRYGTMLTLMALLAIPLSGQGKERRRSPRFYRSGNEYMAIVLPSNYGEKIYKSADGRTFLPLYGSLDGGWDPLPEARSWWRATEEWLDANYPEQFGSLEVPQRTYVLASLQKFTAASDNRLHGRKVSFAKYRAQLDRIFVRANRLSAQQKARILFGNEALARWVAAHPKARLTIAKTARIIRDDNVQLPIPELFANQREYTQHSYGTLEDPWENGARSRWVLQDDRVAWKGRIWYRAALDPAHVVFKPLPVVRVPEYLFVRYDRSGPVEWIYVSTDKYNDSYTAFRLFAGQDPLNLPEIRITKEPARFRDGGTTFIETAEGELFSPSPYPGIISRYRGMAPTWKGRIVQRVNPSLFIITEGDHKVSIRER